MSEKTLTRMELSEAVFRAVGLSRNESAELVERVLNHMSDALVRGETVKISSFGTFSVRVQDRAGRAQPQDRRGGSDRAAPGPHLPALAHHERARGRRQQAVDGKRRSDGQVPRSIPHHQRGRRGARRAAARPAVLGDPLHPGEAGEARRRPALLPPRGRAAAARHPRPALRRRHDHQGRAEDPARARAAPRDRPRHAARAEVEPATVAEPRPSADAAPAPPAARPARARRAGRSATSSRRRPRSPRSSRPSEAAAERPRASRRPPRRSRSTRPRCAACSPSCRRCAR